MIARLKKWFERMLCIHCYHMEQKPIPGCRKDGFYMATVCCKCGDEIHRVW